MQGSGGDYLSNEIHYRVAFLRETYRDSLPNGHIHIGFANYDTIKDRIVMLDYIKLVLEKFLSAL